MAKSKIFRILVCLLLVTFQSIGQRYNVQNYTTKEGLSGQIVNGVFQDKSGYLWFATQSGVCFFNGKNFQSFEPNAELVGVDAVGIIQDQKDQIWIATNANGVYVYDYDKIINYSTENSLPSNVVRSVYRDSENNMWVLTSKGVVKYSKNKATEIVDSKRVFESGVLSMTESSDGTLWFGTQGNGLVELKNEKFKYYNKQDGLKDDYVFSLSSKSDSLLIGTTSQGLILYRNGEFSKVKVPEIENAWISNVILDENKFYIVSSAGLIEYFSEDNYSKITESNGLSTNDLYHGFKDREQNIWLSSGNGVSLLRKEKILWYDESVGLSDDKVTCIESLSNGKLIIGTYGFGLNIIDPKKKAIYPLQIPELMNLKITSIAEIKSKKELWIGAEQSEEGIFVLDISKEPYRIKNKIKKLKGVKPQTVTEIKVDALDNIWVGSFNSGLFKINSTDTVSFSSDNQLPSNEVYTFHLDKQNNPWVSIYQKGVYKYSNGRFVSISKKFNLKNQLVLSISEDKVGNVYLGYKNAGLTVIEKNNKVHHFTTENGLLSNSVQSIICDDNQIWVGTIQGLNKIKFNSNFTVAKVESYNEKSGLVNSELQQNVLKLSENSIWFGSSGGLGQFIEQGNSELTVKPLLEIESIKLFFDNVNWESKNHEVNKWGIPELLNLDYKENHITFVFNALTSTNIQYSYYMEGQLESWTPFTDKNEAIFINIPPGEYKFKVKAINNLGVESDILEIPVFIKGPFWQTWWFRITAVLFVAISIFLFIRYRERRYKVQQLKLEIIVRDRTKEAVAASEKAELQKELVELKNKEILASISYAKRVQNAMMPDQDVLANYFKDLFLFYRPKDIVAGDFYWFEESGKYKMLAVADCTGHGVPGAMVSVVCYNALNRAVREYGLILPGEILDKTKEIILSELSKHDENVKDGMDISLVVIDKETNEVKWSGANNPLWVISEGELIETKGDKQPIGAHFSNTPFKTHNVDLNRGDILFLFTDGYVDQFGGERGKKFKSANLKKLLISSSKNGMKEVEKDLATTFDNWKGNEEQVDDVCIIGFRVD